ncbi:MAG: hypothetical protein BJ554DRAFT_449, partial [Olpidium bornovanus]
LLRTLQRLDGAPGAGGVVCTSVGLGHTRVPAERWIPTDRGASTSTQPLSAAGNGGMHAE